MACTPSSHRTSFCASGIDRTLHHISIRTTTKNTDDRLTAREILLREGTAEAGGLISKDVSNSIVSFYSTTLRARYETERYSFYISTRTYDGTKLHDHDFAKRLRQAEFTLDPSADGFVIRGATSPEV
jgi:hypothetical protein